MPKYSYMLVYFKLNLHLKDENYGCLGHLTQRSARWGNLGDSSQDQHVDVQILDKHKGSLNSEHIVCIQYGIDNFSFVIHFKYHA